MKCNGQLYGKGCKTLDSHTEEAIKNGQAYERDCKSAGQSYRYLPPQGQNMKIPLFRFPSITDGELNKGIYLKEASTKILYLQNPFRNLIYHTTAFRRLPEQRGIICIPASS
ncbi:hypothetical protein [uncultured Bacteroides sp.]|uniref:hypothetical protein n=1 Tax=uncultured Bacteroides sp. TaxID=162156 RepID=UPI0026772865|nr:hypothetical protein [uncultured Bacteroides sp.]